MSTILLVFACWIALWAVITLADLVLPGQDRPKTKDAFMLKALGNFVICLIGGAVTSYFMMS